MSSSPFYVTTPIYYVNDVPHIGHAYTTILADVLARYKRLFGQETYFLTGTDEHGQKVQQAAAKRGIDPNDTDALRAYCDGYAQRFKEAWKDLEIDLDTERKDAKGSRFIRTTEPHHVAFVRAMFEKLSKVKVNGEPVIFEKEYSGWYSTTEERFFSEDELVDGKDPISGRPVEWITEKNYFFRMSAYKDWLVQYIKDNPTFIQPDFRRNEVLGFLRQDLNDLCISRPKSRLAWGVSLPFDEDYVSYVWVDALLNYVTASKIGSPSNPDAPDWPADLHLIGKDILTTHAVYWPTILKALGMDPPKQILAHGWWLIDNARMSKTTGNVVSPLAMKDKYGADAFRYYLIRAMVVGNDALFIESSDDPKDFTLVIACNSDLANNIGNALSRVLKLSETLASRLDYPYDVNPANLTVIGATVSPLEHYAKSTIELVRTETNGRDCQLNKNADWTLKLFNEINRYLEVKAPWKLAKGGDYAKAHLNTILWSCSEALRIGFTLLHPVMPSKMDEALAALGFTYEESRKALEWRTSGSFSLKPIPPLFPRIEVKKAEPSTPSTSSGTGATDGKGTPTDPFSVIDLRAVTILSAQDHPDAEALYVLKVDAGEAEPRTVCAGLRKHLIKDEITGKTAVLVANLKPAKLRGIESHGMLLAAGPSTGSGTGGHERLSLVLPEGAVPGDAVIAEGIPSAPKAQITIKDFDKVALTVKNGRVHYGDHPLISARGPVSASAPDGAAVR